ncbi:hypothetical protein [Microbacterium sp. MPKO10]|uniref:hypothetical protein n=1 Tax=Microbacterium sp. MPKO10 TaxID=2989818 RepID=UPI002235D4BA|nr:hypothetical protein [Microbacterium sp. MPKO10]MCW4459779.1 hypothetical protein [Microbacterium sp. MPKO10]
MTSAVLGMRAEALRDQIEGGLPALIAAATNAAREIAATVTQTVAHREAPVTAVTEVDLVLLTATGDRIVAGPTGGRRVTEIVDALVAVIAVLPETARVDSTAVTVRGARNAMVSVGTIGARAASGLPAMVAVATIVATLSVLLGRAGTVARRVTANEDMSVVMVTGVRPVMAIGVLRARANAASTSATVIGGPVVAGSAPAAVQAGATVRATVAGEETSCGRAMGARRVATVMRSSVRKSSQRSRSGSANCVPCARTTMTLRFPRRSLTPTSTSRRATN